MNFNFWNIPGRYIVNLLGIILLASCVSCKNKPNSAKKKASSTGQNQPNSLAEEWTKNVAPAKALAFLLEPCASSENYNKNSWLGKNSCVWAMQKEILKNLPEYVKETKNGLSFQTDNEGWKTIENNRENQYMLNTYLPALHLFILKYFDEQECEKYAIYDPISNKLTELIGDLYISPDENYFASVPGPNCAQKEITLGRFSVGERLILKKVNVSNPVNTLRWKQNQLGISMKKDVDMADFRVLDLP